MKRDHDQALSAAPLEKKIKTTDSSKADADLLSFFKERSLDKAVSYLDAGAHIDAIDPKTGYSALHYAAQCNDMGGIIFLADRGARVDILSTGRETPLEVAIKKGHKNAAYSLLIKGANLSARTASLETPLHLAVKKHSLSIVKVLIERKADLDLRNSEGLTPFLCAVIADQVEIVGYLLDHGVDKTKEVAGDQSTPFHVVSSVEICKLLLEKGFSPNETNRELLTPLHAAASTGKVNVVEWLIKQGVSTNVTSRKVYSALHYAVLYGQLDVVKLLMQYKVSLETRTSEGFTALHLAAKEGKGAIVTALLAGGANPSTVTFLGKTAAQLAEEREDLHREVAQ